MIQYKSGRLHIPGISFSIPEDFYFYTDTDFVSENSLHFLSPDKRYHLNYQASSSIFGSTARDLALMIQDTGGHELQAPAPIVINGLKGHYAIYEGGDERYYELHLQNPYIKGEFDQLILLLICSNQESIEELIESDTFRGVISEIRPENP